MSMFYELMMRKKAQIMYATIKGSLTENNGVFSGFSESNYLMLQQQFQPANKSWEIVIKANITELNVVQTIVGSSANNKNIQLSIRDTNILRFYRTEDGSSEKSNSSTLTIDSIGIYFFKISFNGSQYKVSVSQNGNDYTDYISVNNSTPIYNNSSQLALGYNGRNTAEYLRGSIDLNQTYIKIGATKYNLQAVVGYTIVGSPTISDGVVSGFSENDYLQLAKAINLVAENNYEIQVGVTLTTNSPSGNILGVTSAYVDGIQFNNSKFRFQARKSDGSSRFYLTSTYSLQTGKTYICNVKRLNNTITLKICEDNILVETVSSDLTDISFNTATLYYRLGQNSYIYLENANILLNYTHIKINNKLWFNGQQA